MTVTSSLDWSGYDPENQNILIVACPHEEVESHFVPLVGLQLVQVAESQIDYGGKNFVTLTFMKIGSQQLLAAPIKA